MIRHTVAFTLKHAAGSPGEMDFLRAAHALASIPTVRKFERLRQVSRKNGYRFGLSMEFGSREDYETYDAHPVHQAFVKERWLKEVTDFMEIDYEPMRCPGGAE